MRGFNATAAWVLNLQFNVLGRSGKLLLLFEILGAEKARIFDECIGQNV